MPTATGDYISGTYLPYYKHYIGYIALHSQIFQQAGVHEHGPKEFGASNGLCSSITESKHIKAVKKPWRCSNHFKVLGQMLITNECLDKLAVAQVDFENCHMLQGSVLSAAIQDAELHGSVGNSSDEDSGSEGSGAGDHESETHNSPCVLNYVCLAKTPACKFPSDIHALAHHVQQLNLPLLTSHFLQIQLQDDTNPSSNDAALPDLSNSPISVFHCAISTFYTPSDLLGLGGMHRVHSQHTMLVKRAPTWFLTISDRPDNDTRMWVVQPELDADGQHELEVVHLHSVLCGAHLIPVYRHDYLPTNIQHTNTLDIFQAYYVNKYIDHHAFEIAF
ncbi:hypothetical protein EDC04DRAFT_3090248 [Pisolithus marmoratus]|nr:hypothetical protein EDC04DRAFT_3090248 [Pisolithus marmoratus]